MMYLEADGWLCCDECGYGEVWIELCENDPSMVIWKSSSILGDGRCDEEDLDILRKELKEKLEELGCSDMYNPEIDTETSPYAWELIGEDYV